MKIVDKDIYKCSRCSYWFGWAKEEYNDWVVVVCKCSIYRYQKNYRFPNPCMIALVEEKLWWKPISDYKDEAGRWIHVPHYAGPALL